ncbi:MAG: ParB/RepB/Spo0J family partition protein [Candidatus Fimenecus sp.]
MSDIDLQTVCKELGITEVPATIKDMSKDEATIAMVDSNIHREHLLPSEKAFVYKMKSKALKHQGKACGQLVHKSRDSISDTESGRNVQRYIRLTYLIPELLKLVDEEKR